MDLCGPSGPSQNLYLADSLIHLDLSGPSVTEVPILEGLYYFWRKGGKALQRSQKSGKNIWPETVKCHV